MQDRLTIRLGGVPEHFNLPIHKAIERGDFRSRGIDLQWHTFDGGTGDMTRALRQNETDACIVLTEGIVADIIKGNPSRLISVYVNTPLCWGIHTGYNNSLNHHDNIFTKKYAISRKGSGSHLMALIDAHAHNRTIDESQFVIINNLAKALDSLKKEETDVFFWEKYTTKPYVQSGDLRRIAEFYTPWPCFVIAAAERIIETEPAVLTRMLEVIHSSCAGFMEDENAINEVSERYQIDLEDAYKWYHATEWATNGWISDKMLKSTVSNLLMAGIIDKKMEPFELVWLRK